MVFRFDAMYLDDPIVPGRALDVFAPNDPTQAAALFFVHGGGWRAGSRSGYHELMRVANGRGFVCATVDYRLAGVHILDQVADVRHGYDRFHSELLRLGRPPKVVVYGSSAGAHLAALLAFAGPGQCGEPAQVLGRRIENDWAAPAGVALQATPFTFEPWEDMFPHIWTSMVGIVGTAYDEAPELYRAVSPIEYVGDDTPPTFVMHAGDEHMFPLWQGEAFVKKMAEHGRRAELKVYADVEHGFLYALTRRRQQEAFEDLLAFAESVGG